MPIIKSAIKRMKQNEVHQKRNRHYSSHMKSMIKLILDFAKKGEMDKAAKTLPKVYSAIDTCAKKNIIHKSNAARKKARVQKALSAVPDKAKTGKAPKAEKAEKKPAKKVPKKAK